MASEAEKALAPLDTMIRFKIGMAPAARCGSWRITCKSYDRAAYTVEAATMRPLRVSEPKAKCSEVQTHRHDRHPEQPRAAGMRPALALECLLPDGREGALVVRKDRHQGGRLAADVCRHPQEGQEQRRAVHLRRARRLRERPVRLRAGRRVVHPPPPGLEQARRADRRLLGGHPQGGFKSRDVMGIDEIYEIRDHYSDGWRAFKAGWIKSTPWADSPGGMAKKTVARRHAKVLPMSTDLERVVRREDEDDESPSNIATLPAPGRRLSLQDSLDTLAGGGVEQDNGPEPEQTGQARPRPAGRQHQEGQGRAGQTAAR